MNVENTSEIIDILNKKKTAAETNQLLGFICIHKGIWKGILHTTPNSNHISEYAKVIAKKEKEARQQDSEKSINELVKINVDFTQYHLKMLADVMEALIGAVFLDCISRKKEANDGFIQDEESKEIRDRYEIDPKAFEETERVWMKLFDPYLRLYADDYTLPYKAQYYKLIGKKEYTILLRENHERFTIPISVEEGEQMVVNKKKMRKHCEDFKIRIDKNNDLINVKSDLGSYIFNFAIKKDKKMRIIYQKQYETEYKRKEHDFYEDLYSHIIEIIEKFEKEAESDPEKDFKSDFYAKKFYTDVIKYYTNKFGS